MSSKTKKLAFALAAILLLTAVVNLAFAEGMIRIDPALPVMVQSPATFSVYIQSGNDPLTHTYSW